MSLSRLVRPAAPIAAFGQPVHIATQPVLPFIPGHERAGMVAALGAGVTGLNEGDPVGVAWLHDACGGCEY